jgi:hypothetical protein
MTPAAVARAKNKEDKRERSRQAVALRACADDGRDVKIKARLLSLAENVEYPRGKECTLLPVRTNGELIEFGRAKHSLPTIERRRAAHRTAIAYAQGTQHPPRFRRD